MPADLGDTMQTLYRQFGELPGVTIELHQELLAVHIENDKACATVFLQGAQLSHYQRHGEPPIIWCSPLCDHRSGVPLRGGIPVCWPWFGALEKNPQPVQQQIAAADTAVHGFVRHRQWTLDAIEPLSEDQTLLRLSLSLEQNQEPEWPNATTLMLDILVGEQLQLTLTVHNRSEQSVCFSSALHSYFALLDIAQVSVDGLQQLDYIDCLQNWSTQRQTGAVTIDREIDRIYHGTRIKPIALVDEVWQRRIEVSCGGSDSAVIWNPWIEKSQRLSQFADDGFRQMLCIETANADRDFVQLAPSQQHQLTLTIDSHPLSQGVPTG